MPGAGFPPGGYTFFDPRTAWYSSPGLTFWQTVDEIITMRKKNPRFADQWSTDRDKVADELDYFTCIRIGWNPRYCISEKKNPRGRPPSPWSQPSSGGAGGAAVARVRNLSAGVGVVIDWLGDSLEPVPSSLAEKRAAVCAVCPMNGQPDWLQKLVGFAADSVKQLISLKNDLDLKTSLDHKLHFCRACDCSLTLKVHAKLDHILGHTSQRVLSDLDPKCWIRLGDQ